MVLTARSPSHAKLPKPLNPIATSLLHCKASLFASTSITFQSSKSLHIQLQAARVRGRKHQGLGPIYAVEAEASQGDNTEERWLLEPVGDGDTRHIGFAVKMPDAFEIASNEVTVGRVTGKADIVLPVATVSGLHARLQKKEGNLWVTDLDSTNGTFIDEKRLSPGFAAPIPPGSLITFGDTHLAIFRVSKLEKGETVKEPEESKEEQAPDSPIESKEPTSQNSEVM